MNIKAKLIEQLQVLENLQLLATNHNQFDTALGISGTILDYIKTIDIVEADGEDDFICPECEEAELEEMLIKDISTASGMASEVVRRVLDAQAEVLDLD